jgi:hypothetical protein
VSTVTITAQKKFSPHTFQLSLYVPQAGYYGIFVEGRTGPNAGALQLLGEEERVGEIVDFYAPTSGESGPRKLGEQQLVAGHNLLYVALRVLDAARGGGVHVTRVIGRKLEGLERRQVDK